MLLNNGVSQAANYLLFVSILGWVPAVLVSNEITALLIAAACTSVYNFLIGNYLIYRKMIATDCFVVASTATENEKILAKTK